jgi:hypothetical protein
MFAKDFIFTDDFIGLPINSQILYILFSMQADDDGLLRNKKMILQTEGLEEKDMLPLIEKGYIHIFESGTIAIMNWHFNNKIRQDRYCPTAFTKDFQCLKLNPDTQYYELIPPNVPVNNDGEPTVDQRDTQFSQGKAREEKEKEVQGRVDEDRKREDTQGGENLQSSVSDELRTFAQLYQEKVLQRPIEKSDKTLIARLVEEYSQKYGTNKYQKLIDDIEHNRLNRS